MSYNQQWGAPFPSLHMWPVHETFAMKMIHLPEGQKIKVGRQTNAKSQPGERNAYFDSKVLSRLHAEIWEQGGKIYIKDIKSSNGTFVNGDRLSPEGLESDPFELKSTDLVEFGIDIVSDDNRTILHHKVAARVYCVFDAEDAAASAREMVYNQRQRPAAPASPKAFSAGGKANGVSFDHVLAKLQAELAKSKETEAELHGLRTTMTDIQDTLGGGLPPAQNGSATDLIPPQYRDSSINGQAAAFLTLQTQLAETQTSLNSHIDRIRQLESSLEQHQTIRYEISEIRDQMMQSQREIEQMKQDDNQSVTTVTDNRTKEELLEENSKLVDQVHSLSGKVTEALSLSQTLQQQHGEAMAALNLLTERVGTLETGIAKRIAQAVSENDRKWEAVRADMQDGWKRDRESWDAERKRMQGVVRDWEEASRRAAEEEQESESNASSDSDKPKRKPRRRRKANLAAQALREMADGTATPTLATMHLKPKGLQRVNSGTTIKPDSETSQSDTLEPSFKDRPGQISVVTVLLVAVVAGAMYYRHKD